MFAALATGGGGDLALEFGAVTRSLKLEFVFHLPSGIIEMVAMMAY